MIPCNKLTLQKHPEQQMVLYKCLRWLHNLVCWTNVIACVQVSTPSNGLMC
jgi:hypothetical protein